MSRLLLTFPLFFSLFFFRACPTGVGKIKPSDDFKKPNTATKNINDYLKHAQIRYDCASRGQTFAPTNAADPLGEGSCPNGVNAAGLQQGKDLAKAIRNETIEDGLAAVDGNYIDFINDLEIGRSTDNFIADVVELGTGAAIGITKGERPLQILGVALTAFRGGRKSIDLNFYKQKTTEILLAKMDDNRSKVNLTIVQRKAKPIDGANGYTLKEGVRDIVDYYNAGTLVRAFTELSKDAAISARNSQDKVLELKGIKLNPSFTPEQEEVSTSGFDQLVELSKEFQAARDLKNSAVAAEQAEGAKKEKILRDKLERVWRAFDAVDIFKTQITALKNDPAYTTNFANITAAFSGGTSDDFLNIIGGLWEKLPDDDVKFRKKFSDTLKATNK